jgi:hypothetical protein
MAANLLGNHISVFGAKSDADNAVEWLRRGLPASLSAEQIDTDEIPRRSFSSKRAYIVLQIKDISYV